MRKEKDMPAYDIWRNNKWRAYNNMSSAFRSEPSGDTQGIVFFPHIELIRQRLFNTVLSFMKYALLCDILLLCGVILSFFLSLSGERLSQGCGIFGKLLPDVDTCIHPGFWIDHKRGLQQGKCLASYEVWSWALNKFNIMEAWRKAFADGNLELCTDKRATHTHTKSE